MQLSWAGFPWVREIKNAHFQVLKSRSQFEICFNLIIFQFLQNRYNLMSLLMWHIGKATILTCYYVHFFRFNGMLGILELFLKTVHEIYHETLIITTLVIFFGVWQHTFVSPSAFSRRAVVSYWQKYVHEVLVNCLGGLSLPRKSVVRLTDHPNMTLDVYRGRKTTMQQQQQNRAIEVLLYKDS